jgi:peptide/nickel transport system permease protein
MFKFLVTRLGSGILVLIAVIILISSIIYLAPVDPARLTFGQRTDSQTLENKRIQLGLDKPLYIQLMYYLRDISPIAIVSQQYKDQAKVFGSFKLDEKYFVLKAPYFRESYQSGRNVSTLIAESLPKTILLAMTALLISTILGLLLGILAAIFQDSFLDNAIIGITTLGYSVPSYVSAIILALIFGYLLSEYTGLGIQGSIFELNDIGDPVIRWKNLILPSIALGIRSISIFAQLTRSAMLDVLSMDYIRTAKAKGLPYRAIIKNHAFRNALNPVATSISGWFASILAGAFFVENVFNFRGIGDLTVTALTNYDIPVLLGCVILICTIFIVINIIMDLIYPLIDPKIELE